MRREFNPNTGAYEVMKTPSKPVIAQVKKRAPKTKLVVSLDEEGDLVSEKEFSIQEQSVAKCTCLTHAEVVEIARTVFAEQFKRVTVTQSHTLGSKVEKPLGVIEMDPIEGPMQPVKSPRRRRKPSRTTNPKSK